MLSHTVRSILVPLLAQTKYSVVFPFRLVYSRFTVPSYCESLLASLETFLTTSLNQSQFFGGIHPKPGFTYRPPKRVVLYSARIGGRNSIVAPCPRNGTKAEYIRLCAVKTRSSSSMLCLGVVRQNWRTSGLQGFLFVEPQQASLHSVFLMIAWPHH